VWTEFTGATERGYTGGYNTLRRYLLPLRHIEAAALAARSPLAVRPAVRRVTRWITGLPGRLDPADGAGRVSGMWAAGWPGRRRCSGGRLPGWCRCPVAERRR
jgi:hypothetical protein